MKPWMRFVGVAAVAATVAALVTWSSVVVHQQAAPTTVSAAGAGNPNTWFVPITPCRIVDTRTAGGPFTPGESRTVTVGGTNGFEAQGGLAGGCGIPTDALAISTAATTINPSSVGFIRFYPTGSSEPVATMVNYQGGGIHTESGGITSVQSGVAASLIVKNYGGTTGLVIDVYGYFEELN